jgi:hypothetical protein
MAAALILTASSAAATDAIRYDRGEITFRCAQIAVTDMNTGREQKKTETFMLMYFPDSGIIQGANQFVEEYPQGSMATTVRQPNKLTGSFSANRGPRHYAGSVTIIGRQAGDEYDTGKITLDQVPLSFVFTTSAEGGGRREATSYRGFCTPPTYELSDRSGAIPAPRLEPGCFISNGEKFCK